MKLTTFSTAKTAKKEIKPISDSENESKTKARSFWTFLKLLLMSAVTFI